jgi:hypothetical protein
MMRRFTMVRRDVLLGSLASIFIFVLVSSGFGVAGNKRNLILTNGEGAVTIAITYLNPIEKVEGDQLAFKVQMDTHSVNLDHYRIDVLTILRDDKGNEYEALGWVSPRGRGHHRSGVVKFSNKNTFGRPIIDPQTKYIEVIIKGVNGIPQRVFKWEFPL